LIIFIQLLIIMKILISWEAVNNDYERETGEANVGGPTVLFHQYFYKSQKYDKHIILSSPKEEKDRKRPKLLAAAINSLFEDHKVEIQYLNIIDVIDVNEIRRKINAFLLTLKGNEIHIFISPGTPAMQTAWHLSHIELKDIQTTLIQTRAGKFTKDGKPELLKVEIEKSAVPIALISKEEIDSKEVDAGDSKILMTESIKKVYELAAKVAQTDRINVLITGPSGSGKENLTSYIHHHSVRKGKPYKTLNCSALNDQLLSSQLFGYKKGAFTGAEKEQKGLFEAANEGTIFLDEIGDISPFMQQSLLRVLQSGEILPLGSNDPVKVDVRVVAATHKDLRKLCAKGEFRWDLYYRLTTAQLKVPGLLERGEKELKEYLEYFIDDLQAKLEKPKKLKVSKHVYQHLLSYTYPGNLREMINILSTLYVFYDNKEVDDFEFLPDLEEDDKSHSLNFEEAIHHTKKRHIEKVLKKTNGNIVRSAELIGWSPNKLRDEVKDVDLDIDYFRYR
jgi:transcriptional regulator with PAS, ATPase and Fis domain